MTWRGCPCKGSTHSWQGRLLLLLLEQCLEHQADDMGLDDLGNYFTCIMSALSFFPIAGPGTSSARDDIGREE